jgi:lipopolysaccharide export system protein LptA
MVRALSRSVAAGALVLCVAPWGAPAVSAAGRESGQDDVFQSLSLGSRKDPIQINADALELDYKSSTITYHGSVQLTQGDVTLTSDRLTISYDPEAVKRGTASASARPREGTNDAARIREVVAEGNVRIRQRERLAEGGRAVFDQATQTIVLSNGAVLHDGPNKVTGERVVVYLQEERSVVESGSGSRVQAVLFPGKQEGAHGVAGAPEQTARGEEAKPPPSSPR